MYLLSEESDQIETLIENTATGKRYSIEGRVASGDVLNGNRRIYESKVLHPAMQKFLDEKVSQGRGFSELNHPLSNPQVNFERVVGVIESLSQRGSNWDGRANIINEGLGKIVIAIMEAGGRVGVSTRALGSLREHNGQKYVNNDLLFTAIDVVSDPSGVGCFVSKRINESITYEMLEDGTIIQLAVDSIVKKSINEEKAIKAFADIMLKFSKK